MTGAWQLATRQRAEDLGHRGPTASRAVRQRTGEQFVQHHAEREHVGQCGDALCEKLFGRGVQRRHGCAGALRERGRGVGFTQQFGDAEVQQFHLPFGVDENVRGLEVAVHDEMLVSVLDCREHLQEQLDARTHVQPARIAVVHQVFAIHVFERDERLARFRDTRIVETRDVRMRKRGQRVALAREPFRVRAQQREQRHLQGNLALDHAVGALGQPDHRHAAPPQLALQTISGEHIAGCQRTRRVQHARKAGQYWRGDQPRVSGDKAPDSMRARRACSSGLVAASDCIAASRAISSADSSRSSQSSASTSLTARLRALRAGKPWRVANRVSRWVRRHRAHRQSR